MKSLQSGSLALCDATEIVVDARKRLLSVDPGLAATQQVEVGPVDDQDSSRCLRAYAQCALWLGHE